jgi:hypothetical protein
MLPIISGRGGDRIKIEVTIDLSGSMLEAEDGDPIVIVDAK